MTTKVDPNILITSDGSIKIFDVPLKSDKKAKLEMLNFYKRYQVLHVRGGNPRPYNLVLPEPIGKRSSPLNALKAIWQRGCTKADKDVIEKSWAIENCGTLTADQLTPEKILSAPEEVTSGDEEASYTQQVGDAKGKKKAKIKAESDEIYYVSCIIQSEKQLMDKFASLLPFPKSFPSFMFEAAQHSAPLWVFLGRNYCPRSSAPMIGRPEHTDCVSHSGTWHYQMQGSKIWYLRPDEESDEWAGAAPSLERGLAGRKRSRSSKNSTQEDDLSNRLRIECLPGDFLVVNTRLWRHHTQIPPQLDISLSLAKDFHCSKVSLAPLLSAEQAASTKKAGNTSRKAQADVAPDEEYTNIEAVFATKKVKKGEIVLRESELPDCSLPRSLYANCEVAIVENEWGQEEFCLVAMRTINVGQCLAVLPSDDEDDGDDEGSETEF